MKNFYFWVLSKFLPAEIVKSDIIPFLKILERVLGIDQNKFESRLTRYLTYPRDSTGKARRLCSYLNTIKLKDLSGVKIDKKKRYVIISKDGLFKSIISIYRRNYATFSYFYLEHQIHVLQNDIIPVMQSRIEEFINNFNCIHQEDIVLVYTSEKVYSVAVSNKCTIGYSDNNAFDYSVQKGPHQFFHTLYHFHFHLEIDLKRAGENTKVEVKHVR